MPPFRPRFLFSAFLGAASLLVGCGGDPGAGSGDPAARAAMDSVTGGLVPAIQIEDGASNRWSLPSQMERYDIPAVSVALIRRDALHWRHGFGRRRAESKDSVTADTRFMVKSIAKPVTAFATLRLVEQGTLELDAPIDRYLERWSVPENEFTEQARPTLRQLLSHQGGFTVFGVPSYAAGDTLPTLLEAIEGRPPAEPRPVEIDYVPGTRSRYSGGGYSVLQLLLEDVTGEDFPSLMAELVLEPVGMTASVFHPGVPDSIAEQTAVGHDSEGDPIPGRWESLVQMAAGGLLTTAPDLARFVIEVNRAWRGESELLSRDLAREMLTPGRDDWALGFEVTGTGDELRFIHTGAGDGFRALIAGIPAAGDGAVILANSNGGSELRYELLRSAAVHYEWPAFQPERRDTVWLPENQLRALAGRYEYSDGSVTSITLENRTLIARWGEMEPARLYPASDSLLFSLAGNEYLFQFGPDSIPQNVVWRGDFGAFEGERVPAGGGAEK